MKWAIVWLLLIPSVSAALETADVMYNSERLLLGLNISTEINIIAESSSSSISFVQANLTLSPKTAKNQQVSIVQAAPSHSKLEDALIFRWEDPAFGKQILDLQTHVLVERDVGEIRSRVPFPLREAVPKEFVIPSENVDSENEEIIKLASQLAEGKDDLYEVVHALATWTFDNIEYDLSTLTADTTQKASWVLHTRQGVCDEVTVLFMALNRALGIPTRFVSGMAYTDSPLFPEKWGLHGWAEVYFPTGWVPFDITYGEFGYVDPSHIKLLTSADPIKASTFYTWTGRDIKMQTTGLDVDAGLISHQGRTSLPIDLDVSAFESSISFGSYNLIEVLLKSRADYYLPIDLSIAQVTGSFLEGKPHQRVLLGPRQTKNAYFLVKVDHDLDPKFEYTFPITVFAGEHNATGSFKSSSVGFKTSRAVFDDIISESSKKSVGSSLMELDCEVPDEIYTSDAITIACQVTNTGTTFLENVNVCLDECTLIDIGLGRTRDISFEKEFDSIGTQRIKITATTGQLQTDTSVDVRVLDFPQINITDLNYPSTVVFDEFFEITFTLKKTSLSEPKNIDVHVQAGRAETSWILETLADIHRFTSKIPGEALDEGENQIQISVTYEDKNGRTYDVKATERVTLSDLTVLQTIKSWALSAERWLRSLLP